jgi:predicted protein tyrosine phosphatase
MNHKRVNILVFSEEQAQKFAQVNKVDQILSIGDTSSMLEQSQRARLLAKFQALCADVEGLDFVDTEHPANLDGPLDRHIQKIMSAAARVHEGATVLIHCRAGVSRSTAVAMVYYMTLGYTEEESYALVAQVRPQLRPNQLVLNLYRALCQQQSEI